MRKVKVEKATSGRVAVVVAMVSVGGKTQDAITESESDSDRSGR